MAVIESAAATLQVRAKEQVADGVVALTLASPDGARLPDWSPGSHIDVMLPNGLTRQYSLCGSRWDAYTYRIGVLREPNSRGGSAWVHEALLPGDRIGFGGPRNNFHLAPAERYLFVAGGIGITPILPMVHQAAMLDLDWTLVYGGRSRASMAFLDELAQYGERVQVRPQDEMGLLPLRDLLGEGPDGRRVYCCGPASLLDGVQALCADWPEGTLRTERFAATELPLPARPGPFEVVLARSGRSVTVDPGTTVLEAVRSAGVPVLSSCRQGVCGTCETAVVEGQPDHRDSVLADHEREAGTCMLVCVSRSLTERLVLDL